MYEISICPHTLRYWLAEFATDDETLSLFFDPERADRVVIGNQKGLNLVQAVLK